MTSQTALKTNALSFDSIKIAHDLPEIQLTTWTFHIKQLTNIFPIIYKKEANKTMVALLIKSGELFVGTTDWTVPKKQGISPRKTAFNIAYGKACQKLTAFMRHGRAFGTYPYAGQMIEMNAPANEISVQIRKLVLD